MVIIDFRGNDMFASVLVICVCIIGVVFFTSYDWEGYMKCV